MNINTNFVSHVIIIGNLNVYLDYIGTNIDVIQNIVSIKCLLGYQNVPTHGQRHRRQSVHYHVIDIATHHKILLFNTVRRPFLFKKFNTSFDIWDLFLCLYKTNSLGKNIL